MTEIPLEKAYKLAVRRISRKLRDLKIHSMEAEEVVNNAYASLIKSGKDHRFLRKRSDFELTDMIRKELGRSQLQRSKKKRGNFEIASQSLVYQPFHDKELDSEDIEFLTKKYSLTEREIEIVGFRVDGKTIAEIGNQIGLSDTRVFQIIQEISNKVKKGAGWIK